MLNWRLSSCEKYNIERVWFYLVFFVHTQNQFVGVPNVPWLYWIKSNSNKRLRSFKSSVAFRVAKGIIRCQYGISYWPTIGKTRFTFYECFTEFLTTLSNLHLGKTLIGFKRHVELLFRRSTIETFFVPKWRKIAPLWMPLYWRRPQHRKWPILSLMINFVRHNKWIHLYSGNLLSYVIKNYYICIG